MATVNVEDARTVVVLGAGVIGLSTALIIQETGKYKVTIVAETLPSDPKSIRYTSQWAGAHHVSTMGKDERQQKLDRQTFERFWELSAPGGPAEGSFLRIEHKEWYTEIIPEPYFEYPEYRKLCPDELLPGTASGFYLKTVTIEPPSYLNWLLSQFLAKGGSVVRASVQHISQVLEGGSTIFELGKKIPSAPDAVVVAAGIGARFLGGVEDKTVFPIRGQTVFLRAPWVKFGCVHDGKFSYVIPRRSGDVIVGGTADPNDWYPNPRPETTRKILEQALELAPELAPESVRAERKPTVDDLLPLVIQEGTGLRPGRKDGIRLEVEYFEDKVNQRKVPVVHNYGHAGYGYQSSWGSARLALELLEGALKTN